MRWKLFATLAETAGDRVVEVSLDGDDPTLDDAFDALMSARPALESEVLDDHGSLQDHVRLLCEGDDPFHDGAGWDEPVADVEELALFPPVSGG